MVKNRSIKISGFAIQCYETVSETEDALIDCHETFDACATLTQEEDGDVTVFRLCSNDAWHEGEVCKTQPWGDGTMTTCICLTDGCNKG